MNLLSLLLSTAVLTFTVTALDFSPFSEAVHSIEDFFEKLNPNHQEPAEEPMHDNAACPDGDHLVKSFPYWNKSETLPCMYAGTIKTSAT